ncbi:ATP-binding protein [Bosea vestrisii]|uniref:ATP-binding protein n=1 Tax=Bosea vestrisii TaxID=151416 RepID=UPI0024DF39AE|nr:ATP-binding protein [Bosea vestrisii]WID94889.1 ATP-binding protein [Bosea vestrisii]
MKRQVGTLDAVPSKRLFLSIIADYDLNKAICELVDNGFDVWTRAGREGGINIKVRLDRELRTIEVEDDAGGLPRDELRFIVGPGQTGSSSTDETIGIFGVGTKRAVVALAQDVRIKTRHGSSETYQVEFDEEWLKDEEWALPLFEVDPIPPHTTRVELQKLRVQLNEEATAQLRIHLGATYARFLIRPDVSLELDGVRVEPRFFDDWSYPPDYGPRRYSGSIQTTEGRTVEIEVLAGLSSESSPTAGEYGVYFYCNDRLVAPAMKSFDVGFTTGQAGKPHPKISLTKVIVHLRGDAASMPWNSSKSDISTKHAVFVALHDWLVTIVSAYARISRIWMGDWPDKVYAYADGEIEHVQIGDFLTATKSYLPDPPKSRPRLAERMAAKNLRLSKRAPWVTGLFEGIVAAETVAKQPLAQANWFALNLLDLTLTSALRSYLVNKAKSTVGDKGLKTLLTRAPRVSHALKEAVPLTDDVWTEIENLARRRDDLTYGRSDPTVSDAELKDADRLVRQILTALHEIQTDA